MGQLCGVKRLGHAAETSCHTRERSHDETASRGAHLGRGPLVAAMGRDGFREQFRRLLGKRAPEQIVATKVQMHMFIKHLIAGNFYRKLPASAWSASKKYTPLPAKASAASLII